MWNTVGPRHKCTVQTGSLMGWRSPKKLFCHMVKHAITKYSSQMSKFQSTKIGFGGMMGCQTSEGGHGPFPLP